MLAALAFASVWIQPETAADYFPTAAGASWTYDNKGEDEGRTRDLAHAPLKIGETDAMPIETRRGRTVLMTTYYRVGADTVWIVAFDPKMPLDDPYPLFKMPTDKPADWTYSGLTQSISEFVPIRMKGKAVRIRPRKVLDVERPCIEVTLEAEIEAADSAVVKSTQKMVYAKGVGLVSMNSKTQVAKNTYTQETVLVQFEAPKP